MNMFADKSKPFAVFMIIIVMRTVRVAVSLLLVVYVFHRGSRWQGNLWVTDGIACVLRKANDYMSLELLILTCVHR